MPLHPMQAYVLSAGHFHMFTPKLEESSAPMSVCQHVQSARVRIEFCQSSYLYAACSLNSCVRIRIELASLVHARSLRPHSRVALALALRVWSLLLRADLQQFHSAPLFPNQSMHTTLLCSALEQLNKWIHDVHPDLRMCYPLTLQAIEEGLAHALGLAPSQRVQTMPASNNPQAAAATAAAAAAQEGQALQALCLKTVLLHLQGQLNLDPASTRPAGEAKAEGLGAQQLQAHTKGTSSNGDATPMDCDPALTPLPSDAVASGPLPGSARAQGGSVQGTPAAATAGGKEAGGGSGSAQPATGGYFAALLWGKGTASAAEGN
eukprot:scaffold37717_cov17-Tisochrysis_lutea.AAC.1